MFYSVNEQTSLRWTNVINKNYMQVYFVQRVHLLIVLYIVYAGITKNLFKLLIEQACLNSYGQAI